MKVKILTLILIAVSLNSVIGQKTKVLSISSASHSDLNGTIYALPQTRISVGLNVTRIVFKHGPYADYAAKYLGINNASRFDSISYQLNEVNVSLAKEPDASQIYILSTNSDDTRSKFQYLLNSGCVLDLVGLNSLAYHANIDMNTGDNNFSFTELSTYDFIEERIDTLYKTILTDSTYTRIPVLKKQLEVKSLDDKAREAAHIISRIRKRRLKMVSGDYNFISDYKSLQLSLEQLENIENKYLSLFIGKTFTEKHEYVFPFILNQPQGDTVICRFSEKFGVYTDNIVKGRDIHLSYQKLSQLQALEETLKGKSASDLFPGQILYRLPAPALIEIQYGPALLFKKELPIDQFGVILGY
jgi:hypothetical protein